MLDLRFSWESAASHAQLYTKSPGDVNFRHSEQNIRKHATGRNSAKRNKICLTGIEIASVLFSEIAVCGKIAPLWLFVRTDIMEVQNLSQVQ